MRFVNNVSFSITLYFGCPLVFSLTFGKFYTEV
jgi:hypothetical protein